MIVRVASLNTLAFEYVRHGTYSQDTLVLLKSNDRIPTLLKVINSLNADVVGLQEVEQPLFLALKQSGAWQDVIWTRKTRHNQPDGCVLLVRPGVRASNFDAMPYSDGSGHILQSMQIGGVTVVNTHIKWAPEEQKPHCGVVQTTELVQYLHGKPAVILGDCNGRPGGRVRTLLEDAGFYNVWGDAPTALIVKEGVTEQAPIDLIAVRGVQAKPVGTLPSVVDIPSPACPSDHIPIVADVTLAG